MEDTMLKATCILTAAVVIAWPAAVQPFPTANARAPAPGPGAQLVQAQARELPPATPGAVTRPCTLSAGRDGPLEPLAGPASPPANGGFTDN
jgi:hypothetical protein